MSSASAVARRKMKEEDPERWALFKMKERERAKAYRAKKKERWMTEPLTRAQEQERERELQQQRDRARLYYWSQKRGRETRSASQDSPQLPPPRKSLKELTPEEYRLHKNKLRAESRARQSAQKKRRIKEKDREYRRQKTAEARTSPAPALPPTGATAAEASCPTVPPSTPPTATNGGEEGQATPRTPPRRLPKAIYNLTSRFKSSLGKKGDGETYARLVRNLATPRTPEKRKAIRALGFLTSPHKKATQVAKLLRSSRKKTQSPAQRARAILESRVQVFYTRDDVSRTLPHRRYATKVGQAYVMNLTLRGAFRQFRLEHPDLKIGYTLFCRLRPRNVKKLGSVASETCLCMYCLNVRYKFDAINRVLARCNAEGRLPPETKALDLLCCPKPEGSSWPKPECISGNCSECTDSLKSISSMCESVLLESVSWTHWGRSKDTGSFKVDVFARQGTVVDLLKELRMNFDQPTRGVTFKRHLFTAFWQYRRYRDLKNTLLEDEVLMVMDFAENRKASYNAEVKSAHFGKRQITLHPIVLYFRSPEGHLARHSLMYLSDDITHDYHLVNHFTMAALAYAKEQAKLKRAFIFSDGCAAQYKGKGTFADLSLLSGLSVQRIYYGSEHGKGEADGETGVLSQALARAVQGGQVNISNAKDLFERARETMSKESSLFTRTFFLVDQESVHRQRPETDVQTVPGTRQFHQVERVSNYVIRCRKLACFCSGCRIDRPSCCINKEYVGEYETIKLKHSDPGVLDTAFVDQQEGQGIAATPCAPSTSSSHDEVQAVETSSNHLRELPQIGQFVLLTHWVGRRNLQYVAAVRPGPSSSESEGEIMVSYMKAQGDYYIFPDIPDEWPLSLDDPNLVDYKILNPPTMKSRLKYVFDI